MFLFLECAFTAPAFGQTEVSVGSVELDSEVGVPGVLGDVDDTLEEAADDGNGGRQRSFEPVVAPLPSRNPVFGWTLSVPAMLMYKPSFAVPEDSVWISGLFGFYAENESWGAGLLQRMSFGGDRWRVMGSLFHADMNYEYFGIGGEDLGIFLRHAELGLHRADLPVGDRPVASAFPPGHHPQKAGDDPAKREHDRGQQHWRLDQI